MERDTIFKKNEKKVLTQLEGKNVLLVRGNNSFHNSGADEWLKTYSNKSSISEFMDFHTNPDIIDLKRGLSLFQNLKCDFILAVGGGSVIDMAKMIRFFGDRDQAPEDWFSKSSINHSNKRTPLVVVPTTSGSGSEATHFAVLYKEGVKYSIADPSILPDHVILKPHLTYAMSSYLSATTGLDAFAQAIEGWWSRGSTKESRQYSKEALDLILKDLPSSVKGNHDARDSMQKAAYLAGRFINIAKTTAPHAFSYILTSRYGLPHGHAVSVSLPFFLEYNLNGMDSKDVKELEGILGIEKKDMRIWAESFISSLGVDIQLKSDSTELIKLFKQYVNLERLNNNPVNIDDECIVKLADYSISQKVGK